MPVTAGKLAVGSLGVLFLWSGVRGASLTGSLRDLVNGNAPSTAGAFPIIGTPADVANAAGTGDTEGNAPESLAQDSISDRALGYVGTPYVWGGANAPHGADCSGLVNDIIGRDLHHAIPGYPSGKFSGHGPVTGQWFTWSGCTTVSLASAIPGDIVVWLSHMGIYVGGGDMVSALNPSKGTLRTTVSGVAPPGEPMRVRRLK
jgi:cell wall-associated NlpC family hydrolase